MSQHQSITVEQSPSFQKTLKKLKKNQQDAVYEIIRELIKDPYLGQLKSGDLGDVRVYKFKMLNQLTLLAYQYYEKRVVIHLLMLGSHENFYRNLKHIIH